MRTEGLFQCPHCNAKLTVGLCGVLTPGQDCPACGKFIIIYPLKCVGHPEAKKKVVVPLNAVAKAYIRDGFNGVQRLREREEKAAS